MGRANHIIIIQECDGEVGADMYLPTSESLAIDTLSGIFSDMSESYKIFWFNSILQGIKHGQKIQRFDDIINRMVIEAWYMVTEYHLNLGPSDGLEKLVLTLQDTTGLPSNAKESDMLLALKTTKSKEVINLKKKLILFVPYRLQAPFMKDVKGKQWDNRSRICERINSDDRLIYSINDGISLNQSIEVRSDWMDYLFVNNVIIAGWLELCMIKYLQRRNPSVPGLADKIRPPEIRKMKKAKDFWAAIVDCAPIENIYIPGRILNTHDLSLDHFVPWSFVAHDELWNLVPTTKGANSSKNNDLPNWEIFFPKLAETEYKAYQMIWKADKIHDLFNRCVREHVNSNEALIGLYQQGIQRYDFEQHLMSLLWPTYQAAKNQGFTEWKSDITTGAI